MDTVDDFGDILFVIEVGKLKQENLYAISN